MPEKVAVFTEGATKPIPGVFSQGIKANSLVFCSGQVGIDPKTGKLVDGTIQDRTHQAIKNLGEVLKAGGSSLENVVKVNVFIADMDDFAKMNEVYVQYFGDVKPCRTCVAVKTLPRNTDVEIEATGLVIA